MPRHAVRSIFTTTGELLEGGAPASGAALATPGALASGLVADADADVGVVVVEGAGVGVVAGGVSLELHATTQSKPKKRRMGFNPRILARQRMGIDYIVDLDCHAKRALGGTQGIVDLVKARSRAEAVLELSRRNGDFRPADQITFKIAIMTPQGAQPRDARVSDLFHQAAALDPWRPGCVSCPANGGTHGFGCYRTINYPIQAHVEDWLLARLPDDPGSTAGQLLRRALTDFGWNGEHASGMRAQGDRFFATSKAARRMFNDGLIMTADQVHHMLFNVGHPSASHCTMVALFLGVLPHDLDPGWLSTPQNRAHVLAYANVPPQSDAYIDAMAQYLRACVLAARMESQILVDG